MDEQRNKIIDLRAALKMICKMIESEKSDFWLETKYKVDQEYLDIKCHYNMMGVSIDSKVGMLKINVEFIDIRPPPAYSVLDVLVDKIEQDILTILPYLIPGTFCVSIDHISTNKMYMLAHHKELVDAMKNAIKDTGLTMDEALPMIMEFVQISLKRSSYSSVEDIIEHPVMYNQRLSSKFRSVLEILTPGAPCPYCDTHLSIHDIKRLYMESHKCGD